ncbi:MAG: P-II family nitrogen regulator [Dehalococcoidales bacterium]|jgi:nitrogen regulatory protein PII 2|nr:P-II family nitrogen regulator [Dehalococcoidales bacterium]
MKEVIAIIRPEKLGETRNAVDALATLETFGQRVLGRGSQAGLHYVQATAHGRRVGISYLSKQMITWMVPDEHINDVVAAIMRINQTGNFGDGKTFVCPVEIIP